MNIKIHWRLVQGGEIGRASRAQCSSSSATGLPDLQHQIPFCRAAEDAGIDGLLVDIGWPKPDPGLLALAMGLATTKVRFIVAVRSGLIPPTTFVQQINSLACMIGGDRIMLNVVAGHSPEEQRYYGDFLDHDKRYARTEEFLAICRALWQREGPVNFAGEFFRVEGAWLNTPFQAQACEHPWMFIAGGSPASRDLAISQGSCWMRLADSPEKIGSSIAPVLAAGKAAGLRLSVMCRRTRAEALEAARALVHDLTPANEEKQRESHYIKHSDSVCFKELHAMADEEWLTPTLWTGAVRSHGAPSVCLVGDPDQVAEALMSYRRVGITHFILSGWPKLDEMAFFGNEVLPRLRALEAREAPALALPLLT